MKAAALLHTGAVARRSGRADDAAVRPADADATRPLRRGIVTSDLCWLTAHPAQWALLANGAGWSREEYSGWVRRTYEGLLVTEDSRI